MFYLYKVVNGLPQLCDNHVEFDKLYLKGLSIVEYIENNKEKYNFNSFKITINKKDKHLFEQAFDKSITQNLLKEIKKVSKVKINSKNNSVNNIDIKQLSPRTLLSDKNEINSILTRRLSISSISSGSNDT
jgi:tRNA A37 N6-isopentenylltransferase MiaA